MKHFKTPLAMATTMALALSMAGAYAAHDTPKQIHEVEETGRHADAERPDIVLLTKVKSKLAMSDSVSALDINVDVEDNVVHLRGTVDNQAQADEAVRLARDTVGVNTVRSHLVVNARATDEQKDRNKESPDLDRNERTDRGVDRNRDGRVDKPIERPDAWVLTKVKTQMLASDIVGALDINVDVDDGVVTLNGEVATRAEAQEAERIARGTEGVNRVKSNLRVTGN